jgi:hypothetical protein
MGKSKVHKVIPNGSHVHAVYGGETVLCGYIVDEINVKNDGPLIGRYLIFTAQHKLWESNANIIVDMGDEPRSLDSIIPMEERCPACREPWWHDHDKNCPWWDMMRVLGYIP